MQGWALVVCVVCAGARGAGGLAPDDGGARNDLREKQDECAHCEQRHFVNVADDFNKLNSDKELSAHVAPVLKRLNTFKLPMHPRMRMIFELLKVSMNEFAHRSADSLYVPDKYNVQAGPSSPRPAGR